MAAMYAAENGKAEKKEIDALVSKAVQEFTDTLSPVEVKELDEMETKDGGYVPWGVTSWDQLDQVETAMEVQEDTANLLNQYYQLMVNIFGDPMVTNKTVSLKTLTDEFFTRLDSAMQVDQETGSGYKGKDVIKDEAITIQQDIEQSVVDRVIGWLKEKLSPSIKEQKPSKSDDGGIMFWKEADGTYRWLARFSNNFRDEDNPPEILSAEAHRNFVKGVDDGVYPLPELWLWHIKEYRWGVADWVALDEHETGVVFVIAGGHVYPGFESMAETISALDPKEVRVSHGMPKETIAYDQNDQSIIVNYQTKEISPLPYQAAANKYTGFVILKEVEMTIPEAKKSMLRSQWKLPDEILARLEQANALDASKGLDGGLETKDQKDDAVQVVDDAVNDAPVETEVVEEAEKPLTRAEVLEAMTAMGKLNQEALHAISEKVDALADSVKELEQTDKAKIIKAVDGLAPASLTDLFMQSSVIGPGGARLDGRTSLAQNKPKEVKDPKNSITGIGFIDDILTETAG
jgi:hypothetical protein